MEFWISHDYIKNLKLIQEETTMRHQRYAVFVFGKDFD